MEGVPHMCTEVLISPDWLSRQGRHYGLRTKLEMSDVLRPPAAFI